MRLIFDFSFCILLATAALNDQSAFASDTSPNVSPQISFFTKDQAGQIQPTSAALFADPIVVSVTSVPPKTKCSIIAVLPFGANSYQSQATFISDAAGSVRTDVSPPISGTYSRADADGLIWSMSQAQADNSLATNAYTFNVNCDGLPPTQAVLPRVYLKPGVRIVSLDGTGLVGQLYLPPADLGPRPAVIAFSGSEGGAETGEEKALYLANHGYVGLGIAYFGAPGVPKDLASIPLEYFQKAIQYLQSRAEVRGDKIAVLGVSRGGELALLLGATFPEIKAVIGQVPGPVMFGGNSSDTSGFVPAWTFQGKPLPAIEAAPFFTKKTLPDGTVADVNRPYFESALQDKQAVQKAFIPIEKINGPILMFGGDDDQVWPSCVLINMAMERLQEKHHGFLDQAICYPKAGHGVGGIPGGSTMATSLFDPPLNALLYMGGTPDGNATGIRDSWNRIFDFLAKSF